MTDLVVIKRITWVWYTDPTDWKLRKLVNLTNKSFNHGDHSTSFARLLCYWYCMEINSNFVHALLSHCHYKCRQMVLRLKSRVCLHAFTLRNKRALRVKLPYAGGLSGIRTHNLLTLVCLEVQALPLSHLLLLSTKNVIALVLALVVVISSLVPLPSWWYWGGIGIGTGRGIGTCTGTVLGAVLVL